ncbi:purine nucleoside permease [Roridomyces roridus]|uniref:Purine nucleoside permease n=1 Tax=Roridomyces roridus TaxID=1738132 RepID=A0AAD7F8V5_9AGAR|nr:purine nucleoside permease [Roridomyces roridus]
MTWLLTSLLYSLFVGLSLGLCALFVSEAEVWYNIPEFNLLAKNITVHCTSDEEICQLVTGEGEINAASSVAALVHSGIFNLKETYFLTAGIAGVNPKVATIGSVTFARYAVQVGLQFEIDAREIPSNFPTGYFAQGSTGPGMLPVSIYGTEVFELNDNLRHAVANFAKAAHLNDSADCQANRELYKNFGSNATNKPTVVLCDTVTSDTFWSGTLLGEAFENTTKIFTNGSATYCATQQEDNAVLNALLRGALTKLVDLSRIIVMRTASDFDRPPANETTLASLLGPTPGFPVAALNVRIAGVKVVEGIVAEWSTRFARGIKPDNYIGDIFGSLGGEPDFGPGSIFGGKPAPIPKTCP